MSTYTAKITWEDVDGAFKTGKFSRAHTWAFDGGIEVPASSSPQVVRVPYSREDAVDPEEAFIASLSSCHMLTFLFLAYREKFVVTKYVDDATGVMAKNAENRDWISLVELHPKITFEGTAPAQADLERLHHRAHEECFIANSVKTEVRVTI